MSPARGPGPRRWPGALMAAALLLAACTSAPPPAPLPEPAPAREPPAAATESAARGEILGRSDRLLVYRPGERETLSTIAARFVGTASAAWMLAQANGIAEASPGVPLVVPLQPRNPLGIEPGVLQTVPILCYHRFGAPASKMSITPQAFEAQLDHLVRQGYRVVRLADLLAFLEGRSALPPRAVVITIDDGYESVYRHAYPLLRKYGLPATLFVYTDFIGAGDALSWRQLQEMADSGLVDVQSHSKSHRNLLERAPAETDAAYRQAVDTELRAPREVLMRRLAGRAVRHIAYPYGDADAMVVDSAARAGYELGATVVPGGNAFFAQPLKLRRTMIFGDLDLEGFKDKLQTSRSFAMP